MKLSVKIESIEEYEYCKSRGYEPLFQYEFDLSFSLRIELQEQLFNGSTVQKNNKYYRWNFENKPKYCEECNNQLTRFNAIFISHILSRKKYPEIAFDPRNNNILCPLHHAQWEDENNKHKMRIYSKNKEIIKILKYEYRKIT